MDPNHNEFQSENVFLENKSILTVTDCQKFFGAFSTIKISFSPLECMNNKIESSCIYYGGKNV